MFCCIGRSTTSFSSIGGSDETSEEEREDIITTGEEAAVLLGALKVEVVVVAVIIDFSVGEGDVSLLVAVSVAVVSDGDAIMDPTLNVLPSKLPLLCIPLPRGVNEARGTLPEAARIVEAEGAEDDEPEDAAGKMFCFWSSSR